MHAALAGVQRIVARTCNIRRMRPDGFVLALIGVVIASAIVPCDGVGAQIFGALGTAAIAALFFLQGARLSRDAVVNGLTHWRLHFVIASTTFIFFPLLGLMASILFAKALPPLLWVGVLFACTLPSTVQSSIALTSIAEGNVAGAVCAATLSSLVGIVLTPVLFGLASKLHGSGINLRGIGSIILELLVPFAAGHLARPWIGGWAARNRAILAITDRSSILLVVYTAFSAAVVHGIWYQLPLATMGRLVVVVVLLLLSGLATTLLASRTLNLARPDEVAVVFCGSQKSLVSGVPIANVLFSSASIGPMLLPIMIYYPLQLVLCAWLARRYATAPAGVSAAAGDASLVVVEMPTSLR